MKQHMLAIGTYIIISIILTFPAVLHFNTHIIGDGGDTLEYYAYFSIVRDNIQNGRFPLGHTPVYRYPNGLDASLSDARLFVVVGSILSLVINSIVVYNMLILSVFVVNGFVAYLFYKLLSGNYVLGLMAGLLYGFSYWTLSTAYGSISKVCIFGFPLIGLIIVKSLNEGFKFKHIYYVAIGLYISSLCSITQLQQSLVILCIFSLLTFIVVPSSFKRVLFLIKNNTVHLLLSLAFLETLLFISFPTHLIKLLGENVDVGSKLFGNGQMQNPLIYVYVSNKFFHGIVFDIFRQYINIPTDWQWYQSTFYIGIVPLLFIFLSIQFLKKSNVLLLFFLNTIVYALFMQVTYVQNSMVTPEAAGWILYPIQYFLNHSDYFMPAFWFFAIGTIVLYFKISKVGRVILCLLLLFFLIERYYGNYPTVDIAQAKGATYASVVRRLSGKAVLDILIDVFTGYNLLPFSYEKPIVGGSLHWFGDGEKERSILGRSEIARFSCRGENWQDTRPFQIVPYDSQETTVLNSKFIPLIKELDIKTVVIHKEYLYKDECRYAREQVVGLFPDISCGEINISDEVCRIIHAPHQHLKNPFIRIFSNNDVFVYQLN